MNSDRIVIQISITSTKSKIWDFWNNPKHITKWNFATETWCCPRAENDLRVGGAFKYRMEAKDGSFGFDFEGIYNEIIEQNKVSYTMGDGRKATTQFASVDGQITVTTEFDPEATNPTEMQRSGWQSILNNFKKYVEEN